MNRSRNITISIVFGVLATTAGAVFWLASKPSVTNFSNTRQTIKETPQAATIGQKLLTESSLDSDQDKLKDWEEAIWHTNPKSSDSDSDGTSDGDEVKVGRDPTKKGPNDTLDQNTSTTASTNDGTPNLTQGLVKNLLQSGVLNEIDQDGNVNSANFLDSLALPDNLDVGLVIEAAATVRAKDVPVQKQSSADDVRSYFTAIFAVLDRNLAPYQQPGDIAVVLEAFDTKNYDKLAELDPIIAALAKSIGEIKRIAAPGQHINFSVRELNYLLQTKRAIEIFRAAQSDPITATLAMRKRLDLLSAMSQFHIDTRNQLIAAGIAPKPKT